MGRSFNLYVTEQKGVALGVLTQTQGPAQQPVGYLNRQLDIVVKEWLACLQATAAIVLWIPEALKLTFRNDLIVLCFLLKM